MFIINIWLLQTGEPLHCDDVGYRPMRAINLANSLVEKGHKVEIWSSAFFHQEKRHRSKEFKTIKISPGLSIHLIPSLGYKKNISLMRLLDHAVLGWNLLKALRSGKFTHPDVGFIGFPPIEAAYVMSRWLSSHDVPFVIDAKDQWPDLFVEPFPSLLRPIVRVIFSPYFYMAKASFSTADKFCSMSKSFLLWMCRVSNRTTDTVHIVAPLTAPITPINDEELIISKAWWSSFGVSGNNKNRFCFIGSLSPAFDFSLVKGVAERFADEGVDCQFVICGSGGSELEIKNMFNGLSNVIFPGWINSSQIKTLCDYSSGSLAPYVNTKNFTENIPNKIIDSLGHGLPIITTLTGEVQDLIGQYDVGFFVQSENDLYFAMRELLNNQRRREVMEKNARNLYQMRYSCDRVYGELCNQLEIIAHG